MALTALVDAGDPVLILAPYWVSYPDLVTIAGGRPVVLPPVPEQQFVHPPADLVAAARQHGAKGVILNFPNNPSGAVPPPARMRELVLAAAGAGLWIISDEIYGTMLYDGIEFCSAGKVEEARGRTVIVNGGTKSHTLTGWRIGFLAGPEEIVAAAGRVQSQVLGNPCTISQQAALAMCDGDDTEEHRRRMTALDERRRYLVREINSIPGLSLAAPKGAFYALVDARAWCAQMGSDDVAIANRLLDEVHVAAVPGTAFAIPGFIRLSFAASMAELERATARIRSFAGAHVQGGEAAARRAPRG
jgi:aspartate aminotransferase